jgi:hypothetical protein
LNLINPSRQDQFGLFRANVRDVYWQLLVGRRVVLRKPCLLLTGLPIGLGMRLWLLLGLITELRVAHCRGMGDGHRIPKDRYAYALDKRERERERQRVASYFILFYFKFIIFQRARATMRGGALFTQSLLIFIASMILRFGRAEHSF